MAQRRISPYGKYGIHGTFSYDFKPIGNERPGDYCRTQELKTDSAAKVKKTKGPFMPVAIILCVILVFAALMSQSSLVALSDEAYELQQEIKHLQEQQRELKIEHAMAFSLAETEEYALGVLGMQKPAADQICCLELEEAEEQPLNEITKNHVEDILSFLKEYFPG